MNIAELQQALNDLGANPQLPVNGVEDAATKAAIIAYQNANGLSADGIVGPATGDSIAAKLRAAGKSIRGIPIELAAVLDCTDWDMPSGGWQMPELGGHLSVFLPAGLSGRRLWRRSRQQSATELRARPSAQ